MQCFIKLFWCVIIILSLVGCSQKNNEEATTYTHTSISKNLSIDNFLAQENSFLFKNTSSNTLNFSRSSQYHWIRFDKKVDNNNKYCVGIDWATGGKSDVFLIKNNNLQPIKKIDAYIPIYCTDLEKNKNHTFYIKVVNPREVLHLSILFNNYYSLFNNEISFKLNFLIFIAGAFFIMTFYHIVLWFSLKDDSYTDIVAFCAIFFFVILTRHNIIITNEKFNDFLIFIQPIFSLVILICALNFIKSLLTTSEKDRKIELSINIIIWLSLILMPLLVFIPNGYYLTYVIGMVLALPTMILMLNTIKEEKKGKKEDINYAPYFALFFSCSSMVPWGLIQVGIIEHFKYAELLLYLGALFVTITIAIIELYRIRATHKEAEHIKILNRSKDRFLMTMSHELRTPMHTVIGMGELLSRSSLKQQQEGYVKQLNTAASHVLEMIDDVLDLSRLENVSFELEEEVFSINSLLEKIEGLFTSPALQKGINFNIDYKDKRTFYLKGDRRRITQVLINLIGNAIKFTEKGNVTLRVIIHTPSNSLKSHIHFSVRDTGIGISERAQKHLFNAFYQEQAERNRQYKGTGLGLAISSHLVSCMGGKLSVHSQLNQGSHFFFTIQLPTHQEKYEKPETTLITNININNINILLVDDDVINASLGQMLLSSKGALVDIVHSGQEAINYLIKQSVDIVFMDVSMPIMDGYETTQRIRALPYGNQVPIIALTAHAIAGERERCLEAGMNDYLTKPYSLDHILHKTHNWLP